MDDTPYSKREQDHFQTEILGRMDKQDIQLNRIEAQTIKTNGRVTKHDWYFKIMWWMLGIIGAVLLTMLPFLWAYTFNATARTQTIVNATK